MHAWIVYLCRVVIAVSMGLFAAGWVICGKIQGDALYQPAQADGVYVHPLPVKRGRVHYITTQQNDMLSIWRPILMGSWAFGLVGFIVLGAVDDARRDRERQDGHAHERF